MIPPVVFLVTAICLTFFSIWSAFQLYPGHIRSITDVVMIGLMAGWAFILVAIGTAIAAVRTRNAGLAGRDSVMLTISLLAGLFMMFGMFLSFG
jgi:hypothetical protein